MLSDVVCWDKQRQHQNSLVFNILCFAAQWQLVSSGETSSWWMPRNTRLRRKGACVRTETLAADILTKQPGRNPLDWTGMSTVNLRSALTHGLCPRTTIPPPGCSCSPPLTTLPGRKFLPRYHFLKCVFLYIFFSTFLAVFGTICHLLQLS